MRAIALVLLVVGCAAAYGWQFASDENIALVWNTSQALFGVFLLVLVALLTRRRDVVLVAALLSVFGLMVAGCSVLYMIAPWPMQPGDERCSTRFNFPLGLMGAVIALALVVDIVRGKR